MESSYWLRFDTGDRRGERVAIPPTGLSLGRGEGADTVLADASVSSRHAELRVGPDGVRVHDLGSKNGTRVAGERVEERLLAHGDRLRLGHVRLTFIDTAFTGAAPDMDDGDEAVHRIDVGDVPTRSRGRGLVVAASFALVAALAAWWLTRSETVGDPHENALAPAPEPVPGDLLGAGSFEAAGVLDGWEQDESQSFRVGPSFRYTGEVGVGADLPPGQAARLVSPLCRVRPSQVLEARVMAEGADGARMNLSFELSSSSEDRAPLALPCATAQGGLGFGELIGHTRVLPGFDRVRLVIDAIAHVGGTVALDDASLIPAAPEVEVAPGIRHDEFELVPLATSAVLLHIDRPIARGFEVTRTHGSYRPEHYLLSSSISPEMAALFEVRLHDTGLRLAYAIPGELSVVFDPSIAGEGVAVIGTGGYAAHGEEFEAEGVEKLLVGTSPRLVALDFGAEASVTVRTERLPSGEVEVSASPVQNVALVLSFSDERARAADLAVRARRAEADGQSGESLGLWFELLGSVPFDRELVVEAQSARSRLVADGLAAVAEVKKSFERARFFDLADIYRRDRVRADALLAQYAGSEVEPEVLTLLAAIDAALVEHVDVENARHVERSRRVADILEREGASGFADHVRKSGEGEEGGGD